MCTHTHTHANTLSFTQTHTHNCTQTRTCVHRGSQVGASLSSSLASCTASAPSLFIAAEIKIGQRQGESVVSRKLWRTMRPDELMICARHLPFTHSAFCHSFFLKNIESGRGKQTSCYQRGQLSPWFLQSYKAHRPLCRTPLVIVCVCAYVHSN